MKNFNAKELLERYAQGLCTDEEKALVESYYNMHAGEGQLTDAELEHHLKSVERRLPKRRSYLPYAAAALIIVVSGYFLLRPASQSAPEPVAVTNTIIQPGGNKAILILANGQKISLTDATNGAIAKEAGISITKTASGQLVYHINETSTATGYNTIETPVGGQYQVELPDGSKVWLNAQSSLRFPLQFSQTERRVEMTGEAYFEVAHNKLKPFRVMSKALIQVLGTHFNVNAYDDEAAAKVTLLEGSVQIKDAVLKPGQQAVIGDKISVRDDVLTDDIVAWKNEKIQFTDTDIQSIMRMLKRWYNIDVSYSGAPVTTTFGGSVSRTKGIDAVLKVLEATDDVHFKIEGRRVIVMP